MATTPRKAKVQDAEGKAAETTVDQAADATPTPAEVPIPTAIKAMWFPATVTLPGQPARGK